MTSHRKTVLKPAGDKNILQNLIYKMDSFSKLSLMFKAILKIHMWPHILSIENFKQPNGRLLNVLLGGKIFSIIIKCKYLLKTCIMLFTKKQQWPFFQ